MLPQINRYNSLKYLIQLNIKTFDENALLFFSCNPNTSDYIIVSYYYYLINNIYIILLLLLVITARWSN